MVLLLEDQPLDDAHVATAEALWPRHDTPSVGEHRRFELPVLLEALLGVEGGERAWGGHVGVQPRRRLGTEALFVVGESQVHS